MAREDSASPVKVERVASAQRSMQTASSVAEVSEVLHLLNARQEAVTSQLDACISAHDEVSRQLGRLDLLRARLGTLAVGSRTVSHDLLSGPAQTAGQISDAVERLDLEQARVTATLQLVEQVAELKTCLLGVVGSMGAPQDWETAAEYVHRASQISRKVIESGFAEQVVPTAEVPDSPSVTLDHAAQSLCILFLREFEKAVEEADGAKITRFFKMFPLIGRTQEGLDAYGKYVCQGVAVRARNRLGAAPTTRQADGTFYVGALTKLFEHIAQVVDGHSNLVEKHYGAGTMVKVMARLHKEADVQGGIILDSWFEERNAERKLTEVKSYAYSFLVQSFLPVPKNLTGTPRSQSPAMGIRGGTVRNQADDGLEMKEIDQLLSEIGMMLRHWSLYIRFISSRASDANDTQNGEQTNLHLVQPPFIENSGLPEKVSKIMVQPFNTFAMFFLRRSVEKAFQLEESPAGLTLSTSNAIQANPPYITSAVDDVMYVVKQILQRAFSTSQAAVVNSTVATVSRVLGADFIGMVQRKMRDESYPKATIQGALPPEDKVLSFLVLLNNVEIATEYIRRIAQTYISDMTSSNGEATQLEEVFPMGRDAVTVQNAVLGLQNGFSAKASELINDGLTVLFQQVLKPRMRPLLVDAFRDIDYSASHDADDKQDDASDEDSSESNALRGRFGVGWEAIVKPMKKILAERNYERLITTTTNHLASLLEKRLWSFHGRITELGAARLERDVSDIVNIAVRGEPYRVREAFVRCLEIVTIMNMDEEEWEVATDPALDDETMRVGRALNDGERVRARAMIKGRE